MIEQLGPGEGDVKMLPVTVYFQRGETEYKEMLWQVK